MGLLSLEHGPVAQRADVLSYAAAIVLLGAWAAWQHTVGDGAFVLARVVAGVLAWTLIEYAVHRLVLHGVPPFRQWHADHHRRPAAALGMPTLLSGALFGSLVFAPLWLGLGLWPARDVTLGVILGYLAYSMVHLRVHRPPAGRRWLGRRQRWHALHHGAPQAGVAFGVTTSFWDHVFGTRVAPQAPE